MKLFVGEDGKPVFENGLPIYVYPDGSKAPFDAKATVDGLNAKITAETEKAQRFHAQREEMIAKLKPFEGLNPDEVLEAIKLKQNLTDKQLLDAKGVEDLKNTMKVGFDEEKKGIVNGFNEQIKSLETEKSNLDRIIFDLAIMNNLATSKYFSGEKPLTIYSPDDAMAIFGHRFKTQIIDGKVKKIALGKDGKVLMSKTNHGEPAEFDEAIAIMVDEKNKTHNIMAGAPGRGPGGSGHRLGDDDDSTDKSSQSLILRGLKKRKAQMSA